MGNNSNEERNKQELVGISKAIMRTYIVTFLIGVILATGSLGSISPGQSEMSLSSVQSIGSGADDWWIDYPDQHPATGSEVDHPKWVLNALKKGPVLILDHSTNCIPCIDQEDDAESVLEDLGDDNMSYFNIISDGSDRRADELLDVYDPDGGIPYIPLTIVVTLVQNSDGGVVVGWHSVVGATGKEWIRSYADDAISYYQENSDDWNA